MKGPAPGTYVHSVSPYGCIHCALKSGIVQNGFVEICNDGQGLLVWTDRATLAAFCLLCGLFNFSQCAAESLLAKRLVFGRGLHPQVGMQVGWRTLALLSSNWSLGRQHTRKAVHKDEGKNPSSGLQELVHKVESLSFSVEPWCGSRRLPLSFDHGEDCLVPPIVLIVQFTDVDLALFEKVVSKFPHHRELSFIPMVAGWKKIQ